MPEEMPKEIKIEYPGTNPLDLGPDEAVIKKYEELAEENIRESKSGEVSEKNQTKAAKAAAKILAATLPPILLTGCAAACQVVEEEQQQGDEKGQETIPSETTETTPKETKEETPPTVEETPEEIEWEGIKITPIEGLRFDKGTFYAETGNPYGLEEGEKAGVFIKDVVEINGVMESSIGLRPEIIETIQKKIIDEDKEFRYPLPFNFEEAKGIKLREVASESLNEWAKKEDAFWDNSFSIEISNIPLGTIIYSPVNTPPEEYTFFPYNLEIRKDYYNLMFGINLSAEGELLRGMDRTSAGGISIAAIGIKVLPEGIEEKMVYNEGPFPFYNSDVKLGTPIAQVISKEYLNDKYWAGEESPIDPSNEPSISMSYGFSQLKNPDKYLETGLENLLKLGKEEIFIFISPAHE
jgi:hypothetical protein